MFIALKTTYPEIQIKNDWPHLQIEQVISKVQIEREGPQIKIDQSKSLEEMGLGGYQKLSLRIRDKNYQQVLEAVARISATGDQILAQTGYFQERMVFSEMDRSRTRESIPEVNLKAIPQTRPKIEFHHEIDISWMSGGTRIKHHSGSAQITWRPGGVEVWVKKAEERGA